MDINVAELEIIENYYERQLHEEGIRFLKGLLDKIMEWKYDTKNRMREVNRVDRRDVIGFWVLEEAELSVNELGNETRQRLNALEKEAVELTETLMPLE